MSRTCEATGSAVGHIAAFDLDFAAVAGYLVAITVAARAHTYCALAINAPTPRLGQAALAISAT